MQNDTISRSELISQLEGLKLSLGDVVLGFVVDRVIELVKAQPAVVALLRIDEWDEVGSQKLYDAAKAALAEIPQEPERWCSDCRYFELSAADAPCCHCSDQQYWEAPHENL